MCWDCRCTPWTCPRRPAGALLSWGLMRPALLSFDDIQGPLAPPAHLVAEPDPAMAAYHAERHARFRRLVSAVKAAQAPGDRKGGRSAREEELP